MFEQHRPFVLVTLRMLGVPRRDLDDATQEVFVVVFQRIGDYEERGRTRNWLYSICIRVAWTRRRALRRRREDFGVDLGDIASAPTQLGQLLDREALQRGCELLEALPPEQRNIFWLYEVEAFPMSEIARTLGCPLQTAYSRFHRARYQIFLATRPAGKET